MSTTAPHFLLLSDTKCDNSNHAGRWSFVLERVDGSGRIEVSDREPHVRGERLKLLAVVRGLEALEQPSRVTLITPSRFIGRGLRNGISLWKEQGWQWERFGEMVAIKNADLWQRIERAREFHVVDCRVWKFGSLQESFERQETVEPANVLAAIEPVIRPVATSVRPPRRRRSQRSLAWTDIAAAVANQIIPMQQEQQAFGCA